MYKSKFLITTALLVMFLVAVPTMAKEKGSGSFTLSNTTLVAGNEIEAGNYNIKWESNSPKAQVTFMINGKVAAEVQGTIVEVDKKFSYNATVIRKTSPDRNILKELRFRGKKFKIVFD